MAPGVAPASASGVRPAANNCLAPRLWLVPTVGFGATPGATPFPPHTPLRTNALHRPSLFDQNERCFSCAVRAVGIMQSLTVPPLGFWRDCALALDTCPHTLTFPTFGGTHGGKTQLIVSLTCTPTLPKSHVRASPAFARHPLYILS